MNINAVDDKQIIVMNINAVDDKQINVKLSMQLTIKTNYCKEYHCS